MQMPSRFTTILAAAILALALAIGGYAALKLLAPRGSSLEATLIGGPFSLIDQDGKRVTEADFRGRHMLVFFGYTYCPDVCPTELQVMAQALDDLGTAADAIAPVFVTIDPARDTPDVMKAYVSNFHPRLVGLTGSAEQIAAIAKAYRVYYAKAGETETPTYLMDHSSIIYLMGPDGRFVKHFTYTTDAGALAEGIAAAMGVTP